MSLITRCPVCRTMFKVVPDQLRISEGWVRCGQCEEVFDAEAHLVNGRATHDEPAPSGKDLLQGVSAVESDLLVPDLSAGFDGAQQRVPVEQHETEVRLLAEDRVLEADFPQTLNEADDAGLVEFRASAFADTRPEDADAAAADSAFLRAATTKRASGWLAAVGRALLIILVLGLGVLQVGQVLRQERNRIAAHEPELRPVLSDACKLLRCALSPWQQMESIVIDSSAFNKVRDDLYRFNLTLRNTAHVDVAAPAIELTLTDVMDQALVRRIFTAEELGLSSEVLKPASENSTSLALRVSTSGDAERIAGYRVLAFYP